MAGGQIRKENLRGLVRGVLFLWVPHVGVMGMLVTVQGRASAGTGPGGWGAMRSSGMQFDEWREREPSLERCQSLMGWEGESTKNYRVSTQLAECSSRWKVVGKVQEVTQRHPGVERQKTSHCSLMFLGKAF